jgi:hypothetical protein
MKTVHSITITRDNLILLESSEDTNQTVVVILEKEISLPNENNKTLLWPERYKEEGN